MDGIPELGLLPWAQLEVEDQRWAAWRYWDDPRPQSGVNVVWSRLNWLMSRIPYAARYL